MDFIVSTGYGRIVIPFAGKNVSEISCHAKGTHFTFAGARTILDMGGQDCKAIRCDQAGKVEDSTRSRGRLGELMVCFRERVAAKSGFPSPTMAWRPGSATSYVIIVTGSEEGCVMPKLDCDVCGREVSQNFNTARIAGRYSPVAVLCHLHACASEAVAVGRVVNWTAMAHATIWLRQQEPNLFEDPDAYASWSPLPRLIALYAKAVEKYPKDLPYP
jgi:hypothetical protein